MNVTVSFLSEHGLCSLQAREHPRQRRADHRPVLVEHLAPLPLLLADRSLDVRGHELDFWDTAPLGEPPEWAQSINRYRAKHWSRPGGWGDAYYGNARNFQHDEALFPCAQVMQKSADWLVRNQAHDKFLLWTEAFDPHEPHFLPAPYRTMYSPDGKDHHEPEALRLLIECGELSDSEAEHRRKLGRELSKVYWQPEHEAAWQERLAREAENA